MARVTVEDCIEQVPNRFDLVILAAQRTKQITSGSPLTVDRDNDKDTVISLREIADGTIDRELVQEDLIMSFRKQQGYDAMDVQEEQSGQATASASPEGEYNQTFGEDLGFDQGNYAGGLSFIEDNVEVDD